MADKEIHDRLHELDLPTTVIAPRKGERVSMFATQRRTLSQYRAGNPETGELGPYIDILLVRGGRWLRYDGRVQMGKVRAR